MIEFILWTCYFFYLEKQINNWLLGMMHFTVFKTQFTQINDSDCCGAHMSGNCALQRTAHLIDRNYV